MPHSSHYGSLLIIVRMKVVQEGEADFLIKNVSELKYGLHFSTVISRWASVARSVPSKYKKNAHTQAKRENI